MTYRIDRATTLGEPDSREVLVVENEAGIVGVVAITDDQARELDALTEKALHAQ